MTDFPQSFCDLNNFTFNCNVVICILLRALALKMDSFVVRSKTAGEKTSNRQANDSSIDGVASTTSKEMQRNEKCKI